jgi:outer membrane protein TolC
MKKTDAKLRPGEKVAMYHMCKVFLFMCIVLIHVMSLQAEQTMSLTLEQCIETALKKSEVISLEKEKGVELAAKVKEIRTGLLPKVSANATFTQLDEAPYIDASSMGDIMSGLYAPFMYFAQNDTAFASYLAKLMASNSGGDGKIYMGDDQIYGLVFTVQQPIFTGFKILNSYRAALNSKKAGEESLKKSRRDLVQAVHKAFFAVLQAQRFVEVSDTSIKQLEVIVRDLENMREQGMVGEQDVMKARVQLYTMQLMKVQANNGVILTRAALCNTIGIPIDSKIELMYDAIKPAHLELPELSQLIDKAHETQPEIKALEYQREAIRNIVKMNRSNYLPNIAAIGNYNIKRPNRSNEPEFYNSWDITLALQMNLFDWGEGWQKKIQSESLLRQLEIGLRQAKNGIALGIEKSYLDVHEAFEKIAITENAMEQSRKSYEITSDKIKFGMAINSDLLDAQRSLTQATIEYHNGILSYYMKRSELEHLLNDTY